MGKPKKKEKTLLQRAKESFQRWVRLRDCDGRGWCRCITCGKNIFWNNGAQGGHYRPARMLATCFDPRNCNPQCGTCNRHGMHLFEIIKLYRQRLDLKYGKGTADDIDKKSLEKASYTDEQLIAIRRKYDSEAKKIAKEKRLI